MIPELTKPKRGYNKKFPLAFMNLANCIFLQTTETSSDGSPRYCTSPITEGTHWIKSMYDCGFTPLWNEEDIEFVLDFKELGLYIKK